MPIEQITKSTAGFLSILTKKYQLMIVMLIIIGGTLSWFTWISEGTTTYRFLIIFGIMAIVVSFTIILSELALKEDISVSRERELYTAQLNRDLEELKASETMIAEAFETIRDWQKNPPPDSEKGVYPYGNGVDLELKVMPSGIKYAFLHIEGQTKKKYKLN